MTLRFNNNDRRLEADFAAATAVIRPNGEVCVFFARYIVLRGEPRL